MGENAQGKIDLPVVINFPRELITEEIEPLLSELRYLRDEVTAAAKEMLDACNRRAVSWSEDGAARELGISTITLVRIRRAGGISHARVGGKARYTAEHLSEYLEKATVKTARRPRKGIS